MSGPSIDLEKPNAIGGLDKLVTNFAIAVIAVVPTFLTCIFKPWRLAPLLDRDDPDGRKGMLLAPGAYFVLTIMVSLILAALLSTPETLNYNGSYIGPDLAVAVQSAAADGDVWKLIATIMPLYGTAVALGILGLVVKRWAPPNWSLRVSLRAAFYVIGTLISWLILTTAVFDLIRLSKGEDFVSTLYALIIIPTLGFLFWVYFWFFNQDGAVTRLRSGLLTLAMFGVIAALLVITDILIRI